MPLVPISKVALFIINCFMKDQRILLLLGYPWAIFVQNFAGRVKTLEVIFFLWTGGFW